MKRFFVGCSEIALWVSLLLNSGKGIEISDLCNIRQQSKVSESKFETKKEKKNHLKNSQPHCFHQIHSIFFQAERKHEQR